MALAHGTWRRPELRRRPSTSVVPGYVDTIACGRVRPIRASRPRPPTAVSSRPADGGQRAAPADRGGQPAGRGGRGTEARPQPVLRLEQRAAVLEDRLGAA